MIGSGPEISPLAFPLARGARNPAQPEPSVISSRTSLVQDATFSIIFCSTSLLSMVHFDSKPSYYGYTIDASVCIAYIVLFGLTAGATSLICSPEPHSRFSSHPPWAVNFS